MDVLLAAKISASVTKLLRSAGSEKSAPGATVRHLGNGVVERHITSFEELQQVLGGLR